MAKRGRYYPFRSQHDLPVITMEDVVALRLQKGDAASLVRDGSLQGY